MRRAPTGNTPPLKKKRRRDDDGAPGEMGSGSEAGSASLTAYIADAFFTTRAAAEAFVASGQRLLRDNRPNATQMFVGWQGETVARFRVVYANQAARPRASRVALPPVAGLLRVALFHEEHLGSRPHHTLYPPGQPTFLVASPARRAADFRGVASTTSSNAVSSAFFSSRIPMPRPLVAESASAGNFNFSFV